MVEQQRAEEQAQIVKQKRDAAVAQTVRDEIALGYKQAIVKDFLLDGKVYAATDAKLAVSGFYKLHGRNDQRLYSSYNDVIMRTFANLEVEQIGLLPTTAVAVCENTFCAVPQPVVTSLFSATPRNVLRQTCSERRPPISVLWQRI